MVPAESSSLFLRCRAAIRYATSIAILLRMMPPTCNKITTSRQPGMPPVPGTKDHTTAEATIAAFVDVPEWILPVCKGVSVADTGIDRLVMLSVLVVIDNGANVPIEVMA